VPLRPVSLLIAVALVAGLAAGCGGPSDGTEGHQSSIPDGRRMPGIGPIGASAKSCDAYTADAEVLHATGIACGRARQVLYAWQREPSCGLPGGTSRGSCQTHSYRCQSVRTARGLAVSCSRPGRSIAFIAKP
jgi:hypothetical protein